MFDVETGLEVLAGRQTANRPACVREEVLQVVVVRVANFVVGDDRRHLDAIPFAGVTGSDIPHVVGAPRSRRREAGKRRRVVTNDVLRQAVAVTPVATLAGAVLRRAPSAGATILEVQ